MTNRSVANVIDRIITKKFADMWTHIKFYYALRTYALEQIHLNFRGLFFGDTSILFGWGFSNAKFMFTR